MSHLVLFVLSFFLAEAQNDCFPPSCCPVGRYRKRYGSGNDDFYCVDCPAGKHQNEQTQPSCKGCTPGRYNPSQGARFCPRCPIGQFQDLGNQTSCKHCAAGRWHNTDLTAQKDDILCHPCSPGYFQDTTGQGACKVCPNGKYTLETGQTSCTSTCSVSGSPAQCCSAGKYKRDVNQTNITCSACPLGRYTGQIGQAQCQKCPTGKYTHETGNTLVSGCVFIDCANGTYWESSVNECRNCAVGTHRVLHDHHFLECPNCTSGRYNDVVGQAECKTCPTGQWSSPGFSACTNCPGGRYSTGSSCSECTVGRYATAGLASGVCPQCPSGRIAFSRGQTGCTGCSSGKYSNDLRNRCKSCPGGRYNVQANQQGLAACKFCPAGKMSVNRIRCDTCGQGRYAEQGSSSCHECGGGKYSSSTGATSSSSCRTCPAGKFSGSTTASSCSTCPAGKYAGSGRQSCSDCAAGRYGNGNTGQTSSSSCIQCPAGKYDNVAGRTNNQCKNCPSGRYKSSATYCSNCPSGKSPNGAKTGCDSPAPTCLAKDTWMLRKVAPTPSLARKDTSAEQVQAGDLQLGDFVLTPKGYEQVFWIRSSSIPVNVLNLTTELGQTISLTAHHLIPTQRGTIPARLVKSGDSVRLARPDEHSGELVKVVNVSLGLAHVTNPAVRSGEIVANDLIVTTSAEGLIPRLGQWVAWIIQPILPMPVVNFVGELWGSMI